MTADRLSQVSARSGNVASMDRGRVVVTEATVDRPSRQKTRWSDLSPTQHAAILVGGVVELIVTTFALRDLAGRPADQVRGWKALWVLTCFVQPIGPIF